MPKGLSVSVSKRSDHIKRRTKFVVMGRLKTHPNNARVGYPKISGVSE